MTMRYLALLLLLSSSTYAEAQTVVSPTAPSPKPAPQAAPPAQKGPVIVRLKPGQDPLKYLQEGEGSGEEQGYYHEREGEPTWDDDYSAPRPEYHLVRKGENLWNLAHYYFGDAWAWPKLWSFNSFITNPHWIYPDDRLRLYGPGEKPPVSGVVVPQHVAPSSARIGVRKSTKTSVRRGVSDRRYLHYSFISKTAKDKSAQIVGAPLEKTMLSQGDTVYLMFPKGMVPKVGTRLSVYKTKRAVNRKTKKGIKGLGYLVRILGSLEITGVKRNDKGKLIRVEAYLLKSSGVIERGLLVGKVIRSVRQVPSQRNVHNRQGRVVATLIEREMLGKHDLLLIDLGQVDDVVRGNTFLIVRRGDAYAKVLPPKHQVGQNDKRYPTRVLATVRILATTKEIAIGQILDSIREAEVGDWAVMRKEQPRKN